MRNANWEWAGTKAIHTHTHTHTPQVLKFALMAAGANLDDTAVFGYGPHNLMVGVVNQYRRLKGLHHNQV
jgi:hypothetical protein